MVVSVVCRHRDGMRIALADVDKTLEFFHPWRAREMKNSLGESGS